MAVIQCLEATHMGFILNTANGQITGASPFTFDVEDASRTFLTANGSFNNQIGGVSYAGQITDIAIDSSDYGLFPNLYITTTFNMTSAIWVDLRDGGYATFIELVLAGADTFYGSRGVDILAGFFGNDVFMTSAGADKYFGGPGTNTVNYASAGAGVVVELDAPGYNTGAAAGDTYDSIQDVIGTNFADYLYGNGFGNVFLGGGGDDTLVGKVGRDTLDGGAGTDTASYDASTSGVTASLLNPSINLREASLDSYVSIENLVGGSFGDILQGNNLANMLEGNDYPSAESVVDSDQLFGLGGDDRVFGYRGADLLCGGIGIDVLNGGLNNDIFLFNAPLNIAHRDVITDFTNVSGNNDSFQLENAVMTKLGAGVHALNPAFFRAGAAALDANDYVVYNKANGALSYDFNGNLGGGVILLAVLSTKPTLTVADFVVI
jgi:Ca2+-binding RTX toxin-like protein